jgi:hypothetical protein
MIPPSGMSYSVALTVVKMIAALAQLHSGERLDAVAWLAKIAIESPELIDALSYRASPAKAEAP